MRVTSVHAKVTPWYEKVRTEDKFGIENAKLEKKNAEHQLSEMVQQKFGSIELSGVSFFFKFLPSPWDCGRRWRNIFFYTESSCQTLSEILPSPCWSRNARYANEGEASR